MHVTIRVAAFMYHSKKIQKNYLSFSCCTVTVVFLMD
jgi:hypothetical protein